MNTKEYKSFLSDCRDCIDDKSMCLSFDDVEDLAHGIFENPHQIRLRAAEARKKFIDNIDENLLIFEKKFSENKGVVHWCRTYDDFIEGVISLLSSRKIKGVNTFASRLNSELGLDESLKEESIATLTSDDACAIYAPDFGVVNTGSLFSVFDSAFNWEVVMGARLKIFFIPINKFVCNITDLELFSHLLSVYKHRSDSPFLSSIYTPKNLPSGSESHVFLIDNGRSNVLASKSLRKALYCIDCDACKRVCPVYVTMGDKPYNNVFSGPYANVVLPFLENYESYKHLSFNSVLCGNCSKICPVNIPLTDLIIENRRFFFENKIMDFDDVLLASRMKKLLSSRGEMNKKSWIKKRKIRTFIKKSVLRTRSLPAFSKESFNVIRTKQQ